MFTKKEIREKNVKKNYYGIWIISLCMWIIKFAINRIHDYLYKLKTNTLYTYHLDHSNNS